MVQERARCRGNNKKSACILKQLPTNKHNRYIRSGINKFEVNIASSEAFGFGYDNNITELIHITSDDKYAGSYSLKVKIPPQKVPMSVLGGSGYRSNITCRFLNYRPTKDTTFSMWYKAILPSGVSAKYIIDDFRLSEISTQIFQPTPTNLEFSICIPTKHHHIDSCILKYSGDSSSNIKWISIP